MNPLSFIPVQAKLFFIAIFVLIYTVSIAWTASHYTSKLVHADWDKEKLEEAKKAQDAYDALTAQYNNVSALLEATKNERKTVYKTITKQVDKIIEREVYKRDCIDNDGRLLLDAALAGRSIALKFDTTVPTVAKDGRGDGS